MNKIGIIMGSDSDLPIAEKAIEKLAEYGINYECMSIQHIAHRKKQFDSQKKPAKTDLTH